MVIGLSHFLVLSAIVFACGLLTILLKRNAIGILMGIELVLNSANINLVAARTATGTPAPARSPASRCSTARYSHCL